MFPERGYKISSIEATHNITLDRYWGLTLRGAALSDKYESEADRIRRNLVGIKLSTDQRTETFVPLDFARDEEVGEFADQLIDQANEIIGIQDKAEYIRQTDIFMMSAILAKYHIPFSYRYIPAKLSMFKSGTDQPLHPYSRNRVEVEIQRGDRTVVLKSDLTRLATHFQEATGVSISAGEMGNQVLSKETMQTKIKRETESQILIRTALEILNIDNIDKSIGGDTTEAATLKEQLVYKLWKVWIFRKYRHIRDPEVGIKFACHKPFNNRRIIELWVNFPQQKSVRSWIVIPETGGSTKAQCRMNDHIRKLHFDD